MKGIEKIKDKPDFNHHDPADLEHMVGTQHNVIEWMKASCMTKLFSILVVLDDFADDPAFYVLLMRFKTDPVTPGIRFSTAKLCKADLPAAQYVSAFKPAFKQLSTIHACIRVPRDAIRHRSCCGDKKAGCKHTVQVVHR